MTCTLQVQLGQFSPKLPDQTTQLQVLTPNPLSRASFLLFFFNGVQAARPGCLLGCNLYHCYTTHSDTLCTELPCGTHDCSRCEQQPGLSILAWVTWRVVHQHCKVALLLLMPCLWACIRSCCSRQGTGWMSPAMTCLPLLLLPDWPQHRS